MEEPEPNPSTHEIQEEPADPQVKSQPALDIGQADYDPDQEFESDMGVRAEDEELNP